MPYVLALTLAASPALAGEPNIEVTDDGAIVARVLVDATEHQVRATIPELQDAELSKSVFQVDMTPDRGCHAIFRQTRGLWKPFEMRTRLCPTDTGWRESLVSSEDWDAYDVEWVVEPRTKGTMLSLKLKSNLSFSVPGAIMRRSQVNGLEEMIAALTDKLFKAKATK